MRTIQECIDFVNQNRVCYLATTEGTKPHVRALAFWYADETGFYFQTGSIKDMYRQLLSNPDIEVCFFNNSAQEGRMLRIAGQIEFITERSMKERVIEERPFLKGFGLTADSEGLIIFKLAHGNAHFWTMESNLKPKEFVEF